MYSISFLAAYREDDFILTGTDETQLLRGELVSASFFPVLGVKPVTTRNFGIARTTRRLSLGA